MKPLKFVGCSREDLQEFPREVRRAICLELLKVQLGDPPMDFKPMPSVGKVFMRSVFASKGHGA